MSGSRTCGHQMVDLRAGFTIGHKYLIHTSAFRSPMHLNVHQHEDTTIAKFCPLQILQTIHQQCDHYYLLSLHQSSNCTRFQFVEKRVLIQFTINIHKSIWTIYELSNETFALAFVAHGKTNEKGQPVHRQCVL